MYIAEVLVCLVKKAYPFEIAKGLQIPMTDGLTDRRTDGRRLKYLSEYVLRCKQMTLQNLGNIF